ncbi:DNA helicase PcrA [Paramaledivibacter caminithermalis]|jgi:DNA helicase-2/ATP-dependent DNA helicase PcrA|uniref:ATP-dependent DNA helicase n=1 Tax=Paramaledivibacter caminithermalis (strain DSM 15212 / CIP 107654 / DViRD3) TaxID=1121301 RepID=A0A1M6NTX7_PARC5|nr:DNA helicase PcrA [Paramaledivibacter caminithermalis]SHJ99062.1 DNA helicase-2 / ATP-dependent DNA helicase PcrA [Paramaledivibacter caminithermalis DSM 15212]
MDLSTLNEKQREAVENIRGPLLILAGAGSGKTRVLTHRIAYLIEEKGVYEGNILAITFTNKAAKEMKERVEGLIGSIASNMWISTFHSACVRILRRDIDKIDYTRDFVIYDTADQRTVIKECLKELNLDEKSYPIKYIQSVIGDAKDKLLTPQKYSELNYSDFRMKSLCDLYELYQKKLVSNNALDFDDLILRTIELFEKNPKVLDFYQRKFEYIMVDEYQDTNKAQYKLVSMLSRVHRNLCVVGDDDQSIYKFRGADIRNILDFEKDFHDAKVIKLEQNYRSTKTILEAANNVIKENMGRKRKRLWTANDEGEKINYYKGQTERDEADFVVREIEKKSKYEKRKFSDFAILYRTNAQSRVIEDSLMRNNIPYRIYGGLKFYDRKEIKDIIAYLRVIQNPIDDVSLLRVINTPKRGIGNKTIERLKEIADQRGEKLFNTMLDINEIGGFSKRVTAGINSFLDVVTKYIVNKDEFKITEIIENVLKETGYIEELKNENTVEATTRIENLGEFMSVAMEFENNSEINTLEEFLGSISLSSDLDNLEDDDNTVTLMTLHSAKGLEFPVVFMVGMEDGVFPGSRSMVDDEELEEERRLCYVGITRAKEELYLTHASMRTLYGRTNVNPVSRFIDDIPQELLDIEGILGSRSESGLDVNNLNSFANSHMISLRKPKEQKIQKKPASNVSSSEIKPGTKVQHKKFGTGTIISIDGTGDKAELTIAFDQQGIKKLMLGFAPIQIVN